MQSGRGGGADRSPGAPGRATPARRGTRLHQGRDGQADRTSQAAATAAITGLKLLKPVIVASCAVSINRSFFAFNKFAERVVAASVCAVAVRPRTGRHRRAAARRGCEHSHRDTPASAPGVASHGQSVCICHDEFMLDFFFEITHLHHPLTSHTTSQRTESRHGFLSNSLTSLSTTSSTRRACVGDVLG